MRALLLEAITEADIRTWPNPDPGTLPAAKREGYLKRQPIQDDRRKTELLCTQKAQPIIARGQQLQRQLQSA